MIDLDAIERRMNKRYVFEVPGETIVGHEEDAWSLLRLARAGQELASATHGLTETVLCSGKKACRECKREKDALAAWDKAAGG